MTQINTHGDYKESIDKLMGIKSADKLVQLPENDKLKKDLRKSKESLEYYKRKYNELLGGK